MQVRREVFLNRSVLDAYERVSVQGNWLPGNRPGPRLFFSMTFVAAMMVGGIELAYKRRLDTNRFHLKPACGRLRRSTVHEYETPVPMCMGQEMGHFRFGSTVVLVRRILAQRDFAAKNCFLMQRIRVRLKT